MVKANAYTFQREVSEHHKIIQQCQHQRIQKYAKVRFHIIRRLAAKIQMIPLFLLNAAYRYDSAFSLALGNLNPEKLTLDLAHISKDLGAQEGQGRINHQVEYRKAWEHHLKENAENSPAGERVFFSVADG